MTSLLDAGLAYRCYCTREEIEAREAARPKGAPSGYDGFCRNLSEQRVAELEAMSVPSVVRMRVPDARSASTIWSAARSPSVLSTCPTS